MVAAPDALRRTGRRRRVAAIGSGFGGLTATKALKHAEVNITDALVFLARITAQGASYVVNQTPPWLPVVPAIAGLAATIGAVIALYVQRTPRRGP
jgi:CHASE2 domain-containing sensor protein